MDLGLKDKVALVVAASKGIGKVCADILAALGLVYFLVQEGREALHEARTGESCQCGDEECSEN